MVFLLLGIYAGFHFCFTFAVAILFAMSSDHFNDTELEKLGQKVTLSPFNSLHETTIAIATLCFLTFFSAIASFIFFLCEIPQVGFATLVISIASMIPEGIYTYKSKKCVALLTEYDHKDAQKYIKDSIEELYNQGINNLRRLSTEVGGDFYLYFDDIIAKWDEVESQLGQLIGHDHIITYSDIWQAPNGSDGRLRLVTSSDKNTINARFYFRFIDKVFEVPVATTTFTYSGKIRPQQRYCWYVDDNTNIKCKNLKEDSFESEYSIDTFRDVPTLAENIVVGSYISGLDPETSKLDVNYRVNKFPSAYSLIDYDTSSTGVQSASDSTNHFKVKGKKWAKAYYKYIKHTLTKMTTNKYGSFFMAPNKVKSIDEYVRECEYYDDPDQFSSRICRGAVQFDDIAPFLKSNYEDTNRGKVPKSVRNYYIDYYFQIQEDNSIRFYVLYDFAIVHLVLQIVMVAVNIIASLSD